MKIYLIYALLFITGTSLFSQIIKDDFDFDIYGGIRGMTIKNNLVVVVGGTGIKVGDGLFTSIDVSVKKDGKWIKLPNVINRNGLQDSLYSKGGMKVAIDSKENIWVTGNSLLQFDGKSWNEYYIDDEYHGKRVYRNIVIDQNDKVYFTSSVSIVENGKAIVSFSEIHSFKNSTFASLIKKESSGYFQMAGGFTNPHPFVVLQDTSVLLVHYSNYEENVGLVDMTQIMNDGMIKQHYLLPPDNNAYADKTVHIVSQDRDGTIWFPIFIGFNGTAVCCRGVTKTTDFQNYIPLTNEVGLPYFLPNQDAAALGMTELENGDILFAIGYGNLIIVKYDYLTKTATKIHWPKLLKNATLIKKSSKNPNFPNEWYEEALSILSNIGSIKETRFDHSAFQSLQSSNSGMVYIAFSDFVLEIPFESITSTNEEHSKSILYPNPSNDVVKVISTKEIAYVSITNLVGKQIKLDKIGIGSYSTNNVPSGFYSLMITYKDSSVECHSFIKL